jgi:hypothetical protein
MAAARPGRQRRPRPDAATAHRTSAARPRPVRVVHREALHALCLTDRRSGYPLQMVVRAADAGWRVHERDVLYLPRTGSVEGHGHLAGDMERRTRHAEGAARGTGAPDRPAAPLEATGEHCSCHRQGTRPRPGEDPAHPPRTARRRPPSSPRPRSPTPWRPPRDRPRRAARSMAPGRVRDRGAERGWPRRTARCRVRRLYGRHPADRDGHASGDPRSPRRRTGLQRLRRSQAFGCGTSSKTPTATACWCT